MVSRWLLQLLTKIIVKAPYFRVFTGFNSRIYANIEGMNLYSVNQLRPQILMQAFALPLVKTHHHFFAGGLGLATEYKALLGFPVF
jgi:hypothetical protein